MRNKTVTVDLEAYPQPCTLGSVSGGFHSGEMLIYSGGRQTGKSMLTLFKSRYYDINLCKEIMLPMITKPKSKSNYQFSRNNWHWVEINSMADDYYERLAWCEEMFGAQPKNPDAWTRWYSSWSTLKFRDEKDYMLYQLRWS